MKVLSVTFVGLLALCVLVPISAEEPIMEASVVEAPAANADFLEEGAVCNATSGGQADQATPLSSLEFDSFACVSESICGGCSGYLQCAVPREDGCCYPELPQCVSYCTWGCGALCAL